MNFFIGLVSGSLLCLVVLFVVAKIKLRKQFKIEKEKKELEKGEKNV